MPNRDGTGPQGKGSGTGRGRGMRDEQRPECGKERPREEENPGSSAGEVGWEVGAGPEGFCICLRCKKEVKHITGVSCSKMKCPDCGIPMARKL
ncbi:MAG: DUF5320 domain-containing protein [Deltaproteobacteria bacterium]|nr:DUF5320 domain-containing protein [Deltaproteobacteria bacterium]RLC24060.1 MAG: hypothetical protein DRH21_06085 [Deltaproteobacteria bacterium]